MQTKFFPKNIAANITKESREHREGKAETSQRKNKNVGTQSLFHSVEQLFHSVKQLFRNVE